MFIINTTVTSYNFVTEECRLLNDSKKYVQITHILNML